MKYIQNGKVEYDKYGFSYYIGTAPTPLQVEYYSQWCSLWYNGFIAGESPDDTCPFPI